MSRSRFGLCMVSAILLLTLLVNCQLSTLIGPAETATPQPTSTPQPTPTPEIVQPEAGITLTGSIDMDQASSAGITLKVSVSGQEIEQVSVSFTDLTCEGFSAGSTSTMVSSFAPIVDGRFEFTTGDIGDISGQFTSPTEVQGTIHLAFFDGAAECGTWQWSASGN